MRGLRTNQTTQVIIAGHAFMQNLRRGYQQIAVDVLCAARLTTAHTDLARAI